MSVWDTSLQITTGCSVIGAWLGAFPIPLDWDRPWQVSVMTLLQLVSEIRVILKEIAYVI